MRIVSLVPNATEILFAIGAGDEVVGVSHECDYPAEARRRPALTGSALRPGMSAAEVDQAVAAQVGSGLSLYTLDEAGIDVLGIVTNEVRTRELLEAKVSVSPALGGESFGLVLAEAFACATPAVASNIPGYAGVATPEAAVLVPPGEVDALADAIVDVLSDEARREAMGQAARAHALASFASSVGSSKSSLRRRIM